MSSTSTPKKPPAAGPASASKKPLTPSISSSTPNTAAPSRSPSRMTADSGTATRGASTTTPPSSNTSTMNRSRSVLNGSGAPMSARAAARKPATPTDVAAASDDAKAELQAKLDELQEKLREAERLCEDSQKHAAVLQVRLDEAVKEQGMLEEHVHEHTERIEELENEKKENVRARRELEQIYEAERAQTMREKEDALAKEEELQSSMLRMREALSQKELRERNSSLVVDEDRRRSISRNPSFRSGNGSPGPESSQFAPSSSLQRSDSRSSSRLVMQKDKIIEGLRLELAEAQIKLVELENHGGGHVHELQKEIYVVKMQNARLMEENESFQLLLSEKTLNGDLAHSDLLRPPSRAPEGGASLAEELEGQDDTEGGDVGDAPDRRAQAEVNSLKDQNKALTLYINNIISRLLQHEQFEQILDKTPDLMAGPGAMLSRQVPESTEKELPPPPPPKDDAPPVVDQLQDAASGFLQRARSVIGAKPKGRPTSVYQSSAHLDAPENTRVHENPDTAPRIPLGRSASTRGHRRANSEWPAASVTNMMYRGPSPGIQGPASPGLTSPTLTGRNSFFGPGALGARVPSTGSATAGPVPTITEQDQDLDKENISLSSSSHASTTAAHHRSSVVSNPSTATSLDAEATTAPAMVVAASPPRSTTSSSGDRERVEPRPGGAIMMGSRPRPLRLVQENAGADEDKTRKAANRGSWFGWMNKGGGVPGLGDRSGSGSGGPSGGAAL